MKTHVPTYTQGRKCLKCGAPISDQTHQSRKHCPREVLLDGSVKSCKDDRNAHLRKERDKPFREQMAFQKQMSLAIASLRKAKGDSVTVDDLDRYDIFLEHAPRQEVREGRLFNFFFNHYWLEQLSLTHFKIHPHAHSL